MSVIGGLNGAVDGHKAVRNWQVNHTADIAKMVASNTLGGTVTLEGNKDWSGVFRQYGHIPAVIPGAAFTFTGSVDGSTGAFGPARVTSLTLNWGHEASDVIATEIAFQANGALTLGAASVDDVSDFEDIESSVATLVKLVTPGSTAAELEDVRSVQLVLTANNASYKSSSTAGETKSDEGPWDWTAAIDMYSGADLSTLPTLNLVRGLQLFVNATEYWELLWGRVGEMTNLSISPETGELVTGTLNMSMHGIETIAATPTDGVITHPDGAGGTTTIWP